MKVNAGSVQVKKGWFYLVTYSEKGHRWKSLHTKDREEAMKLATKAAPLESVRTTDEAEYLRAVIAQGEAARRKLEGLRERSAADALTWADLFGAWKESSKDLTRNPRTLANYESAVDMLSRWAGKRGIDTPSALSAAYAARYAAERADTCSSFWRDVTLFRRVWRDLKLPNIWDGCESEKPGAVCYRRLTVDEVRRVVKVLRTAKLTPHQKGRYVKGDYQAKPDLADLVLLGYHTGIRRGDLVKLTALDVSGEFINFVPAKTEGRKGWSISAPLQTEALAVVQRLTADGGPLFTRLVHAMLNHELAKAFKRAGVLSDKRGKASFHSLRATFISAMDDAGVPVTLTDKITGHAPKGMHGRYSHPSNDALMEAVKLAVAPLVV